MVSGAGNAGRMRDDYRCLRFSLGQRIAGRAGLGGHLSNSAPSPVSDEAGVDRGCVRAARWAALGSGCAAALRGEGTAHCVCQPCVMCCRLEDLSWRTQCVCVCARAFLCVSARWHRVLNILCMYLCMYACCLLFCGGRKSNMCLLAAPLGANVQNDSASASCACWDSV